MTNDGFCAKEIEHRLPSLFSRRHFGDLEISIEQTIVDSSCKYIGIVLIANCTSGSKLG